MNIFYVIYCMPLKYVFTIALFLSVFWCGISVMLKSKPLKLFNSVCFIVALSAAVYQTVIARTPHSSYQLILTPLAFIKAAKTQPEVYRSVIMNAFLFLPLGLSFPFVLPEKLKFKMLVSVGVLCFISFSIEFIQYKFSLGRVEADDVIFNALGSIIGLVAYIVYSLYKRRQINENA